MANYHLEVQAISRGKGRSVTKLANYISGYKLHDSYTDRTYYHRRSDVLCCKVYQPAHAPLGYHNLQHLCNEIDRAEKRYDARTAREFKCSLPNELPTQELIRIISEYIDTNFTSQGLCAIAAIHEGRNKLDPSKSNPHVHIIVPTRVVRLDGFSKKKDREHDKRKYITLWRERWAEVQNRAYERCRLDIRVSHESLEIQGKDDREPTIHLSRIDWQKEQRGEHTEAGDKKRDVEERNIKRVQQRQLERDHELEIER